jgi:alpha-L-arabinofuranosidase
MISVINRSPESDVTAKVQFRGSFTPTTAQIEEVSGAHWDTTNSFADPDAVSVRTGDVDNFASGTEYRFPAHSHTVIVLPLT